MIQERILREIEEDKMKRRMEREAAAAAKAGTAQHSAAAPAPAPVAAAASSASDPNGKCLIRIRRLDGGQVTEEFLNGDSLKTVYHTHPSHINCFPASI